MKHLPALAILAALALSLALVIPGCGTTQLLTGVSLSAAQITPDGKGLSGYTDLQYSLSRPAKVSVLLQGPSNQSYSLRQDEPRQATSYTFRFSGVVPSADGHPDDMKVIPDGAYSLTISAVDSAGVKEQKQLDFSVKGADDNPPAIQNSVAYPSTITPNYDAIDDVTLISFRLTKKANVGVYIGQDNGERHLIKQFDKADPGEYKVTFDGKTVQGNLLANGKYKYYIVAEDPAGNRVTQTGDLTIANGGEPQLEVEDVQFSPIKLMYGEKINVTIRVKNTGKVTLRTQGPDPGYAYTTNDTFASIANGQYADQPGYWRVGVDWDGNAGSGPRRYPFRWGFGKDLAPGEEATITGSITILQKEREMWFYAGVIQEGIGFPADQLGRTLVEVGF